jgi:hypothetical protein
MSEIILPFALVPIVLRAYLKSQGREGEIWDREMDFKAILSMI